MASEFVFTPIDRQPEPATGWRFQPLDTEGAKPSTLRNVALNNPLAAMAETAMNLGSQGVALPVAGLAGIGTVAARAIGLTGKDPADVVHAIGSALTYVPRGEMGRAATEAVMIPFEKLAELGSAAGGQVLDATDSPVAATAVDTAVNALPMAIAPSLKAGKAGVAKVRARLAAEDAKAVISAEPDGGYQFSPLEATRAKTTKPVQAGAQRMAGDDSALHRSEAEGLAEVRRSGNPGLSSMDGQFRFVPLSNGAGADATPLVGPAGRARELRAGELPLDDTATATAAAKLLPEGDGVRLGHDSSRGGAASWATEAGQRIAPDSERFSSGGSAGREAVSSLDVADLQRRDAAASRMGAADRAAVVGAVEEDQARYAPRPGADTGATPQSKTARWALIEADQIKASHDVNMRPVSENPFVRQNVSRAEHELATQGIVRDFTPERLAEALDDADGAPVVARDGVVEAGQRRAIALQRVYQANGAKAEAYRQYLRANAGRLGLDPIAVDQMKRPVLVRLPDDPAPRRSVSADFPEAPVRDQIGEANAMQEMAAGIQNGTWSPGANYQGFVDQVRAPSTLAKTVADLPAPLRREQIVTDLAKALETTIYEGRVKGKNRLGFFRPGVHEVRIKHANDIEVAAHEVAHLIDRRVPELANTWRGDKALREELKSVSYDQKSVPEGFAEGMRLFLTQPDVLEARAPKVFAWLNDFTDSHRYGPALRQAQEQMVGWFGQDALNRARSKIGTDKPLAEYFDRFWDKFRQSIVDDLHGIYRMERDLTGKVSPNGPYESARLSRASASIADGSVRYGYPVKQADGSFKFAGKGLDDILKPVAGSLDDALLYFVGKSANELMGQGREHLFSKGEIEAMLRLRTPERETAFTEYQAWNKGILDFAEAQGIINPEARALWQRTQYLPFHRVEQPGGLKGKPGEWQGIQALTGGTTNLKDVLGNMIGNAAMLLDKAVKNEARLKISELSQQEGGGKFMVKIDTEARPVKVAGDQVLEAMLKKYGIAIDGDAPAFFEFLIHGQPPAGKNVVAVLQHGKPVWFEVGDPILYRALSAIDRPMQNEVVRWLGLPKRIGQATITATPDFWMANIARDTLMGSVMSRAGFRPVLDSIKGMNARMLSDPTYREFLANGGGMSSYFLDERHFRTKLEKFYQQQGVDYRTVLDAPDKLLGFVETLGDAFEMSTRLGEYRRAINRGESPRHAAYLGRDVSTDFAMKGDSKALGFMYDTVIFLRPALVSWDRLYRGLAHDENKGAIAAKAGTMALLSAGLYLLNRDDPRYADLPDWDRDANWHFFIGDQHFRWPKIWEIGALSSAAERTVEKIMATDPEGLAKDFGRILGATFNLNWMPQLAAPLYEQATNRNAFTKAPIETPGMENVQPFLRSKPGTSETMKAVGRATGDLPESMQVNPARAEALLRGYFNTYAMYGLMLSDKALFGDQLPEKRADELPVVRRFYSQEPAKHTKYEAEFYEMLGEAKRLRGTLKELDELGRRDWADRKERSPLAGEAKPLERAQKNLGAINKDMEAVRRDQGLTSIEKRQRLDGLTVERNALLKDAVLQSQAAQRVRRD